MNKDWKWLLVLGYPLLVVNLITASLYAWLWCGAKDWKWQEGCLTFIPGKRPMLFKPGGQGWSPIIGYANESERSRRDLRVHEVTHVWQELVMALLGVVTTLIVAQQGAFIWWLFFAGGPAFMALYGVSFGVLCVIAKLQGKTWRDAYHKIPFELHAYWVQLQWFLNPERRTEMWGDKA